MPVNSVDEKQRLGLLERLVQAALERNVLVVVFSLESCQVWNEFSRGEG